MVLIITIGLARWSFEYGFLDYRRSLEAGRLEFMSAQVVEHFARSGESWGDDTPLFFDQLVRDSFPDRRKKGGEFKRPPPPDSSIDRRRKPGNERFSSRDEENKDPRRPKDDSRKRRHRKGNGTLSGGPPRPKFGAKTALFDHLGNRIAGDVDYIETKDSVRHSLQNKGSKIGELRASILPNVSTPEEKEFERQQTWASVIIAISALLLAGVASWFLSRMLLVPIYRLKNGIEALAKGRFGFELDSNRGDELGELMTDVDRLSATLAENQRSRRRWLADISHELRTPVTILSGEVEAMIDGVRDIDTAGIESFGHEVDRLKHLVDDLYQLSLSDLGGLRYEFGELEIVETLQLILEPFISRAKAKGLTLDIDVAGAYTVIGDRQRLEQLFTNVINNSIAYTDSPGIIRLSFRQEPGFLTVSLDDSAPTVATHDFEVLFEPLYREEDSRNRRSGGAGLGLTICKNIVEAHQGRISAEQSLLGGVCMKIELPTV